MEKQENMVTPDDKQTRRSSHRYAATYWVVYQPPVDRDGTQPGNLEWHGIADFDGHKRQKIASDGELRKGSWFARPENKSYESDRVGFFRF